MIPEVVSPAAAVWECGGWLARLEASARAGPLISASHETFHLMLAPPHQPPANTLQHTAAADSNIIRRLAFSATISISHPPSSPHLLVPCTRRLVESRRLGLVSKHTAARPAQSSTAQSVLVPGAGCRGEPQPLYVDIPQRPIGTI